MRSVPQIMFSIFIFALFTQTSSSQCTICQNGQQVTIPDNILSVPGFPPLLCGVVDATLALLVPNETSAQCFTAQSLGSLCGCPLRPNYCPLCPNGNEASLPSNQLPFLSDLFLGFVPTCEILEAYLTSRGEEEAICFVSQSFIGDYCGCNSPDPLTSNNKAPPCSVCPNSNAISNPNRTINIIDFPFQTCAQLEEALGLLLVDDSEQCSLLSQAFAAYCGCAIPQDSCSLCRDGRAVPLPDAPVELLKNEFGGIVPTCAVYESYVAAFDDGSKQCSNSRLFGSACGCPSVNNHCEFCPGEAMPEASLDTVVSELEYLFDFTATCRDAESFLQLQISATSDECILGQLRNFVCGCNDGKWFYLGADTPAKQVVLAWAPRISAIVSFIGSILIVQDILSSPKRRKATYSQLMLGMSLFDMIGCIAWGMSTAAVPMINDLGEDTNIYGAAGNEATCKTQGFLIQLNFTALFYNISLSTYYLLVIVYGWRDQKLKRNLWWLHGVPVTLGVGLALGGIPFYQVMPFGCHIQNPPMEDSWYPIVFFAFVPIFGAILFTTAMMTRVYLKVRRQSRKAAKWKFPKASFRLKRQDCATESSAQSTEQKVFTPRPSSGSESRPSSGKHSRQSPAGGAMGKLERDVFYQSLFYLSALYFSWTFLLAATIVSNPYVQQQKTAQDYYGLYLASFTIVPLQGLWNCLIYFRPRIMTRRRKKKQAKQTRAISEVTQESNPSSGLKNPFRRRTNLNNESSGDSNIEEIYDPSADIAVSVPVCSSNDDHILIERSADGVRASNLEGIAEELKELESASSKIEEYGSATFG